MIIVEITGGLGNQMFQYALYCKLSSLYPKERVLLDVTEYDGKQTKGLSDDRRLELNKVSVDISKVLATKSQIRTIKGYTGSDSLLDKVKNKLSRRNGVYIREDLDKGFDKQVFDKPDEDVYLSGYWQCEKYFSDIRDKLLETFVWNTSVNSVNSKGMSADCAIEEKKIVNANSVAVHIRRGDYLYEHNSTVYGGICTEDYYRRAIDYMCEHTEAPEFFFFSNDVDWVNDNLIQSYDENMQKRMHLVSCNGEDNHEYDMYLMTKCKHNIIANSSFSWWGAWLGVNEDKIVVAPKRWFNNHEVSDQICEDWIRL